MPRSCSYTCMLALSSTASAAACVVAIVGLITQIVGTASGPTPCTALHAPSQLNVPMKLLILTLHSGGSRSIAMAAAALVLVMHVVVVVCVAVVAVVDAVAAAAADADAAAAVFRSRQSC